MQRTSSRATKLAVKAPAAPLRAMARGCAVLGGGGDTYYARLQALPAAEDFGPAALSAAAAATLDAQAEATDLVVVTSEGDLGTGQALAPEGDELAHPGQRQPGRRRVAAPSPGGGATRGQGLAQGVANRHPGGYWPVPRRPRSPSRWVNCSGTVRSVIGTAQRRFRARCVSGELCRISTRMRI